MGSFIKGWPEYASPEYRIPKGYSTDYVSQQVMCLST